MGYLYPNPNHFLPARDLENPIVINLYHNTRWSPRSHGHVTIARFAPRPPTYPFQVTPSDWRGFLTHTAADGHYQREWVKLPDHFELIDLDDDEGDTIIRSAYQANRWGRLEDPIWFVSTQPV